MKTKKCRECTRELSLAEFYKDSRTPDGYKYICKDCEAERSRKYHIRNREAQNRRSREYRLAHLQEEKAYRKRYYIENKEEVQQRNRRWLESHRKERRAYERKRYAANTEKILAQKTALRTPETSHECYLRWKNKDPERARNCGKRAAEKRRISKLNAEGSFTDEEWITLCIKYNYTCLCCGRKEPEIKLGTDHIVPLSRGGTDYISNIQPLCRSCNSSKRQKTTDYRKQLSANS